MSPTRSPLRYAWVLVLSLALLTRVGSALSESAYLHPDAIFQGVEPAFRALWGYGVVTWEFREGLRSWLWPGLLMLPMKLSDLLGGDRASAVLSLRIFVASIDLAMIVAAMRLARSLANERVAVGVGLFLALHPAFFVMGAQPLIDVPATAALLGYCERAFGSPTIDRRRGWLGGSLFALTALLRPQLVPALVLSLVIVRGRTLRGRLDWERGALATALWGMLAVTLFLGALDWLTWGAPFHSTWRYLTFNLGEGQTHFGSMPVGRYWRDFGWAFPGLREGLLALALWGGLRRSPALLAVIVAIVLPHQWIDYRVWRFLHPALPLLVLLAGIGVDELLEWGAVRRQGRAVRPLLVTGTAVWLALGLYRANREPSLWKTSWLHDRGGGEAIDRSRALSRAYLFLSEQAPPRRILQGVLPAAATPGLAWLGHPAEILHALDRPPSASSRAAVDVWILPELPPQVPASIETIWSDERSGVVVLRRRGAGLGEGEGGE